MTELCLCDTKNKQKLTRRLFLLRDIERSNTLIVTTTCCLSFTVHFEIFFVVELFFTSPIFYFFLFLFFLPFICILFPIVLHRILIKRIFYQEFYEICIELWCLDQDNTIKKLPIIGTAFEKK